jgi:predicted ATP-dependent protease
VFSLTTTVSLEPDPIPIDLKVVLVGSRLLYYLMSEHLPEFRNLFKVAADFEDAVERSPENVGAVARLIASLAKADGLLPLGRSAVARAIDDLSRRIEDSERLSTGSSGIADLLREADYFARKRHVERIEADDVDSAIAARRRRLERVPDRILEAIERGIVLIDTSGEAVGQINGLSVIQLGEQSFGHPTRITATARLGKGQVIDVQREVELGGAIHSKGVFILSSFLGARFASDKPLALSASLVFEQTYAHVDGDSASTAETCALLSALAGVALRQDLAVTGSMNQHGQVQAIGGVNQKIEGFFDLCQKRGLTGTQGVLIPHSNVQHLMLRSDVVEAVTAGRFSIYPIRTVDEALAVLTGREAGVPDEEGRYPAESVNGRVQLRLEEFAEVARQLGSNTLGSSTDSSVQGPIDHA